MNYRSNRFLFRNGFEPESLHILGNTQPFSSFMSLLSFVVNMEKGNRQKTFIKCNGPIKEFLKNSNFEDYFLLD